MLERTGVSMDDAQSLFEKLLLLKSNEYEEITEVEQMIVDIINESNPGLLKIEREYGDMDFETGDFGDVFPIGAPVINSRVAIRNPVHVKEVYEDLKDFLYPENSPINKFLLKNSNGVTWYCMSPECQLHRNKIADLNSLEKVVFYLTKIKSNDGFYKCHRRGCKNTFEISNSGDIKFSFLE